MVRRASSTSNSSSVGTAVFKSGDVVWAPYRNSPDWPSVIRCVYPKKVTYVFLPEREGQRLSTFHCAASKLRQFSADDALDPKANNALREAYRAAVKLVTKQKSEAAITKQNSRDEKLLSLWASTSSDESNTSQVKQISVFNDRKSGNEYESASTLNVGDIVFVEISPKIKWPMIIRQIKKKFVMVDAFPLVEGVQSVPERYYITACEKVNIGLLPLIIEKENDEKLKEALNSVRIYVNCKNDHANAIAFSPKGPLERGLSENSHEEEETSITESNIKSPVDSKSIVEIDNGGISDQALSFTSSISKTVIPPNKVGSRKRDYALIPILEKITQKRQKFSDDMLDLEEELEKKIQNLSRGEVAWLYRSELDQKWPVVVVRCDKEKKLCYYKDLPFDISGKPGPTESSAMKNISLYDTVSINKDDVADEELKLAVTQADEIVEGKYIPLDDSECTSSSEWKQNGQFLNGGTEGNSAQLNSVNLFDICRSDECRSYLELIWLNKTDSNRHASYKTPSLDSVHLTVAVGDLLSESDCTTLIDLFSDWLLHFSKPILPIVLRVHYAVTVALPEAVTFSIAKLRGISVEEANIVLSEASQSLQLSDGVTPALRNHNSKSFEQLLKVVSDVRQQQACASTDKAIITES